MRRLARDGMAQPVSRDYQNLRRENRDRETNILLVQLAHHDKDWQLHPVDENSAMK